MRLTISTGAGSGVAVAVGSGATVAVAVGGADVGSGATVAVAVGGIDVGVGSVLEHAAASDRTTSSNAPTTTVRRCWADFNPCAVFSSHIREFKNNTYLFFPRGAT